MNIEQLASKSYQHKKAHPGQDRKRNIQHIQLTSKKVQHDLNSPM